MIRLGECRNTSSGTAGRQAAAVALATLPDGSKPGWALVFAGGRHDPNELLTGLRAELGSIPIVGGSAAGTLTRASRTYQGDECAVAVFPDSLPPPTILIQGGLEQGEKQVGLRLGARVRKAAADGQTVMLFYDSIHSSPPPVLHVGSYLTDGVYAGLADRDVHLIGAGLIGDHRLTRSFVFNGEKCVRHAAVAVILPAEIKSRTTIMHGCSPISEPMEITRIDGATVYELDGKRAFDVLMERLKPGGNGHSALQRISLNLTLGEKRGYPHAEYNESNYVNRLIVTGDPDAGSVTLFEADFRHGTRVQVMARDNAMMINSVRERTQEILGQVNGNEPFLGLYIDCAGRCKGFSGADVEEGDILACELGESIPLLGFYSGVEIAPVNRRSRPLDWTGVLTLFSLGDD